MDYDELRSDIRFWLGDTGADLAHAIPKFIKDAEAVFNRNLHVQEMECRVSRPLIDSDHGTSIDYGVYPLPADWNQTKTLERVGDNLWLTYYRQIPALTSSNTENWLSLKYPDVYRYASLACAQGFLADEPRMAIWKEKARMLMDEVSSSDVRDVYSGGPLRSRLNGERPWRGSERYTGRYEPLPAYDLHDRIDTDPSGQNHPEVWPGYFAVTEGVIRVWPIPTGSPSGAPGWSACQNAV